MITHSFARTSDGTANYCIWPAQTDRQRMHVRETGARSRSLPLIPVRPHPSASVRSIKCKVLTDFYCLSRFVSAVESTTRSENTRARGQNSDRMDRIFKIAARYFCHVLFPKSRHSYSGLGFNAVVIEFTMVNSTILL